MSQIPDDLAVIMRRAAAAVPSYSPDSAQVQRRWRRRRRQRLAAVGAGAAVVVAIGVAVLPVLAGGGADAPPMAASSAGAPAAAQAQRLLLDAARLGVDEEPAPTGTGISELLPDGSIIRHRLPGLDGWSRLIALGDGRLVGLGYDDLGPDAPRADGPGAADLSIRLSVLSSDDSVQVNRPVGDRTGFVRLVAATARAAFLWRPAGLVEHDLATGRERTVLPATAIGDVPDQFPASRLDLVGQRLVVAGTRADPCRLRVVDVRTGVPAEFALPTRCAGIGAVRVSADGRFGALSYVRTAGTRTEDVRLWIVVVDLTDGGISADMAVTGPPATDSALLPKRPAGMAWLDGTTVRVAVAADGRGAGPDPRVRQQLVRIG